MNSQSTPDQAIIRQPFKWWHAVILFFAANIVSALPVGFGGDEAFYNSFNLPAIAPPDWLFAPIWLFLNVTSLIALWLIANRAPSGWPKTTFLWLEGIGWILFAIFTTLYFGMKSPILGAVDTVAGLAVALGSLVCCYQLSRSAFMLISLRFLWLLLASVVSVYVAINNSDPFFGI